MLTLSHLRKSFGSLVAVDDLSLAVAPGEILGLLGPNGAGKTTTVRMAIGLLAPDSGEVRLEGKGSPTEASVRRHIGVAPQALALYDDLSGEENVRLMGSLAGLGGTELARRIDSVLELVGLADRRHDRARVYSGGMKRRLNLAMALVHDPDLLLLDEPTVGVDPQSRNHILESIRSLRDAGKSIVYTTHYMEEAEKISDRVAIVDHGKVLTQGTVDELLREHGGPPTLVVEIEGREPVRTTTERPLAELQRLAGEGEVVGFTLERPGLEQVFLHLTGRTLRDE